MGYRRCGTGVFVATKQTIKEFKQILEEHYALDYETGKCHFDEVHMSTFGSTSIVVFKFNGWNWNGSFPEVKSINDFIERTAPKAGLVVIGEDDEPEYHGDPGRFKSLLSTIYVDNSSYSEYVDPPAFMKKDYDDTSGVKLILDGSDIELLKKKKDDFEE